MIECLAILLVVAYHLTLYEFDWINEQKFVFYFRYFLRTILSICVPLFFFANGYLLLNQKFELRKHIFKIIKIIILSFAWGLFCTFLSMSIHGTALSLKEIIECLWTWNRGWVNHFWYMGALVCIYIFFPLLKITYDSCRKAFVCFTGIVMLLTFGNVLLNHLATIVLSYFRTFDIVLNENWFVQFNPFRGIYGWTFVYFCVGGLCYGYKDKILNIPKRKKNIISVCVIMVSSMALFLLGVVFTNITGKIWDVVWYGYNTLPTFINVVAIFIVSLSYERPIKLVKKISRNTLGIFYFHAIIISISKDYIRNMPFGSTFVGNIIYAGVLTLLCAYIADGMKKIPLIKQMVKL